MTIPDSPYISFILNKTSTFYDVIMISFNGIEQTDCIIANPTITCVDDYDDYLVMTHVSNGVFNITGQYDHTVGTS